MNSRLYALNVGRGDSFFVEIETGKDTYVLLIDGGDDYFDDSVKPIQFIRNKGWQHIDLMILTHLHPDHVTGLLEVAEHIPVREAVLPYPPLEWEPGKYRHPKAAQSASVLSNYRTLQELLLKQNSNVSVRHPFGQKKDWQFGDIVLRHLDPQHESDLFAYTNLLQLADSSPDIQEKRLVAFDSLSNLDSSVWLLEQSGGEQLFLFGGDALLSNWERIMKTAHLHPRGFKIGHHGMLDAWNEQLLQQLSPDWLLITNHNAEYEQFREEWTRLAQNAGCQLFVTGSQPGTHHLASRLPFIPERMELK
ncbi:ComEC/Rec2 family competence protein [Paenibacillus thalictri]|uniref:MBL fold metallo-hydrolase n=1 Tax=Paenibacillus thalictri TaxID=2527873 RepID=A0A4Q9DLE7_9BACL|nr:MBL fold metallo-hydrolase [Paenibacillus thalictri]TBL73258.1 MBL fold metallo-hydrolase [Paenibacillus thalictri]